MAQELYRTGLPWRVYVFGDYDPSGLNIFETVRDDVRQFFRQFNERNGTKRPLPKFEMVTITEQQVIDLSLPTGFVKSGDTRAANFPGVNRDQTVTCECEALPPDVLADFVKNVCTDPRYFDKNVFDKLLDLEEVESGDLRKALSGLTVRPRLFRP